MQPDEPDECALKTARCCCVRIEQRDTIGQWMLLDPRPYRPSLFQKCCLCQWSPAPRNPGGVEFIRELRGLAGVLIQEGEHSTADSLQTLKYAAFDPVTRQMYLAVFGGFLNPGQSAWSEPVDCRWLFLMNLARLCNYTYKFSFSEDYRYADIDIMANLTGPFCPCVPAWFALPRFCVHFSMEQNADSRDGDHWERYSSMCGCPRSFSYDLLTVIDPSGSKTRWFAELESAPPLVMVTY